MGALAEMHPNPERPIDRMQRAFPDNQPVGHDGWYSAKCPAHDDSNPSLSFREGEDGNVIIKCHAGCTREAVLEAAGLTWKHLSPRGNYKPVYTLRPKLELIDLAADKLLPWQFLFNQGIEDGYLWHGQKVIKIPYYTTTGEEHTKVRLRIELSGNKGSRWDEDTPGEMIPYGLHKLDMARKERYLLIGEGESDAWSCWWHGIPYLGVPGATNEKCLDGKILADIPHVYIIQEPDKAGQAFYKRVHNRLRSTSYEGEIHALPFKRLTKCKDPNALHKHLRGRGFKEVIEETLKNAIPSGDEIDSARPPKVQPVLLRDLQKKTFPPIKWAIPEIVPEGLILLCGKSKSGKSWMLLHMMDAITRGGTVLGCVAVDQGDVLYLSLEDNERRLVDRSNTIMQNLEASPRFWCKTEWPRMDQGGLKAIEEWLQAHPQAILVGIDTWAISKPKSVGGNRQQYDEDYEALTPLQKLAGKYHVSIVIVHHIRKMPADDYLDTITGSVAMAGAVDGFLILVRERGNDWAKLFVTGRDIEEEKEYPLLFDRSIASWKIAKNEDSAYAGTPEQQAILDVLKQAPDGLTLKQIVERLQKNLHTTRNLIVKLRNTGLVTLRNNVYSVVSPSNHSNPPQSGINGHTVNQPDKAVDATSENDKEGTMGNSNPLVTVVTPGQCATSEDDREVTTGNDQRSNPIVTPDNPMNQPEKAVDATSENEVTMVTRAYYGSERFVL